MKKLLITSFVLLLVSACMEKADTPKQVTEKYWDALRVGDQVAARKLVSKGTQQNLDAYLALKPDQKTSLGKISLGAEQTTVTTIIYPINAAPGIQHETETLLILEDGLWKIDAARTQVPVPIAKNEEELVGVQHGAAEGLETLRSDKLLGIGKFSR